jgi:hypothetical protein
MGEGYAIFPHLTDPDMTVTAISPHIAAQGGTEGQVIDARSNVKEE